MLTAMGDSGSNLAVRGVGCLFLVVGALMFTTGWRIRKGTSRFPMIPSLSIYGSGVFLMTGALVVLMGIGIIGASL